MRYEIWEMRLETFIVLPVDETKEWQTRIVLYLKFTRSLC